MDTSYFFKKFSSSIFITKYYYFIIIFGINILAYITNTYSDNYSEFNEINKCILNPIIFPFHLFFCFQFTFTKTDTLLFIISNIIIAAFQTIWIFSNDNSDSQLALLIVSFICNIPLYEIGLCFTQKISLIE